MTGPYRESGFVEVTRPPEEEPQGSCELRAGTTTAYLIPEERLVRVVHDGWFSGGSIEYPFDELVAAYATDHPEDDDYVVEAQRRAGKAVLFVRGSRDDCRDFATAVCRALRDDLEAQLERIPDDLAAKLPRVLSTPEAVKAFLEGLPLTEAWLEKTSLVELTIHGRIDGIPAHFAVRWPRPFATEIELRFHHTVPPFTFHVSAHHDERFRAFSHELRWCLVKSAVDLRLRTVQVGPVALRLVGWNAPDVQRRPREYATAVLELGAQIAHALERMST